MQQVRLGGGRWGGGAASYEYKLATIVNIMEGLQPQESKLQTYLQRI